MNILLPATIFLAWLAFTVMPAGRLAIEDIQNNVPLDKRRGTTILPVIPIFPLAIWGLSVFLAHITSPVMLWVVLAIHVILLLGSLTVIVRDTLIIKKLNQQNGRTGAST